MVSFAVQKYISLMTTYFFIAFPHLFVFCFITYIIFKGCTIIQKKKKEGQATCRITQNPSSKCTGIEIVEKETNGTEANLQSDELA